MTPLEIFNSTTTFFILALICFGLILLVGKRKN